MTRTETKRATIFIVAVWVLIAGFAVAAFAQEHSSASTCPAPETIETTFDLGFLPPLDSIGPHTGVAAFMQSGAPLQLQVAALRRAWSVDPSIRDFKGLQENDWNFDFDGPIDIAGFGDVSPDHIRWMLAQLFTEPTRVAARTTQRPGSVYSSILLVLTSWLGPAQGAVRD
jgi:hypothetical protein